MDDALVAEPGPTTLPPLRRPAAPVAAVTHARATAVVPVDGPLLTIDPVPLPDRVPAGSLPPPPPSPFAVLPAPVWCVLPAVGWQQRATRPIVTPLPDVAPSRPPVDADHDDQARLADRIVDVAEAPAAAPAPARAAAPAATLVAADDEVAHLFPDGWPDAWTEPGLPAGDDGPDAAVGPIEAGHDAPDDDLPDAAHDGGRLDADRLVHLAQQAARWASFAVLGAAVWVLLLTTVPRLFGWQPTVITGHSMEPAIARGDVVVVRPAPPAAYVPGAVITFSDINRPGHLITHRVIKVNDDGTLVTRGDNNHDNDPQATPVASVKGRAVLRVPFVGRPVVWMMDRSWLPLAVTVAVLLFVIRTLLHPGGPRRHPRPWPLFSAPARRT